MEHERKQRAESIAKQLARSYEREIQKILEKTPMKQLEEIQVFLRRGNHKQLLLLAQDLLQKLKDFDEQMIIRKFKESDFEPGISYYDFQWFMYEDNISDHIKTFQQFYLSDFLTYSFFQAYLNYDLNFRNQLLKKHNLTPKKLKDLLLQFLSNSVSVTVKRGGKKDKTDDSKILQFFALYNRYLIVIQNARKERKTLQRKFKKSEINAKREVMEKYEIPEDLILSVFSDSDTPSEIALDLAKDFSKIDLSREYLKVLLPKIRKDLKKRCGNSILIDVDFSIGIKYFGFNARDKQKASLLRFTPLDKSLHKEFLFQWNF
jgi:hypothetical protein